MTPRRRAARLLGAASVTTLVVTVSGVLMGSAASETAPPTASKDAVIQEDDGGVSVEVAAPAVPLPDVKLQRDKDFTAGDDLPDGAKTFDSGANTSGMALVDGLLVHGAAEGPAAGFIETKLKSDVALLGVRVRFAESASGSVALVGWQESLVQSRKDFGPTPATGMRLVAGPGHWELSVVNGDVTMLGTGSYEPVDGPSTFELIRSGSTLYLVDPAGEVTEVDDKRVAKLAGPWASWGLTETGPEQTPASIEAVWAG